jgi:S1-C subfamily serine protease
MSIILIILILIPATCYCEEVKLQRAVPYGILSRVYPIKIGTEFGSCFVIDIDDKQYIITAKHLLPKVKSGDSIEVYIAGEWRTLFVKPILPKNEKTDVIALAADKLVAPKMAINIGLGGIFVGQDVFFLGYPFGLASQSDDPSSVFIPFIKKGILSAIDSRSSSGHVLYVDGHNNPGFSGGPVIFANYKEKETLYVAGVISGYRHQETKVIEVVEKPPVTSFEEKKNIIRFVLENTGIVIAYSIDVIVKEIRANPIGVPLSQSNAPAKK